MKAEPLILHELQSLNFKPADSLTIKLNIYITFDFEMKLLSYGANVEVLEPGFLRESIKQKLKDALLLYN